VPEQEVWVGEGNTCIPGRFEYTVQEVVFPLHFVFLVERRSLHQHQHLSEWKSTETRCAALVAVGDKYWFCEMFFNPIPNRGLDSLTLALALETQLLH
jgi:hypothetical protein